MPRFPISGRQKGTRSACPTVNWHLTALVRCVRGMDSIVDANIGGDDDDGPHARSCRFPYLLFALSTDDTSRTVPDSARVTRIDMDTPGSDSALSRFCIAHQPPNER